MTYMIGFDAAIHNCSCARPLFSVSVSSLFISGLLQNPTEVYFSLDWLSARIRRCVQQQERRCATWSLQSTTGPLHSLTHRQSRWSMNRRSRWPLKAVLLTGLRILLAIGYWVPGICHTYPDPDPDPKFPKPFWSGSGNWLSECHIKKNCKSSLNLDHLS